MAPGARRPRPAWALGLACASLQAVVVGATPVCDQAFAHAHDMATDAGVVRAVEYLDDGTNKLLASGGEDHILRVWDLGTFSTTATLFPGHEETIWSLEWIADHNLLASAGGDGTIRFWPISVLMASQTCSGTPAARLNCCDGNGLGCQGEHVVSYRDAGLTVRRQVFSLHWISSANLLVSGWGDGVIRTWTYNGAGANPSWSYSDSFAIAEGDRPYGVHWMSGPSLLAMISQDWPHPRLFDDFTSGTYPGTYTYLTEDLGVNGGFGLAPHAHRDAVLDLSVNAAGTHLATGSRDNTAIIWDGSAKDRTCKLEGHTGYVASVAWLDSETKLATGSGDNTIKIWDMSDTTADQSSSPTLDGHETLSGHTGQVNDLVWFTGLSQGQLASGDANGGVKLWNCVSR